MGAPYVSDNVASSTSTKDRSLNMANVLPMERSKVDQIA